MECSQGVQEDTEHVDLIGVPSFGLEIRDMNCGSVQTSE